MAPNFYSYGVDSILGHVSTWYDCNPKFTKS